MARAQYNEAQRVNGEGQPVEGVLEQANPTPSPSPSTAQLIYLPISRLSLAYLAHISCSSRCSTRPTCASRTGACVARGGTPLEGGTRTLRFAAPRMHAVFRIDCTISPNLPISRVLTRCSECTARSPQSLPTSLPISRVLTRCSEYSAPYRIPGGPDLFPVHDEGLFGSRTSQTPTSGSAWLTGPSPTSRSSKILS